MYLDLRLRIWFCVRVFGFALGYFNLHLCILFCVCVFYFAFVYSLLRLCIWFCVRVFGFAFVYSLLRLCIAPLGHRKYPTLARRRKKGPCTEHIYKYIYI